MSFISKELEDWIQHFSGKPPSNVARNIHPKQEKLSKGKDGFQKAPKEEHRVLCLCPWSPSLLGRRFLNVLGF